MNRYFFALVLTAGILALGVPACSKQQPKEKAAAAVQAQQNGGLDFSFTTLDGAQKKLSDFRGQVVIIDLWDTWCPPCRMEIPHFIELQKQYRDKGFTMLGIAFGREGEGAVRRFAQNNGINYPNALMTQEIYDVFGPVNSIPTTFVIDRKGNIYKKYIGYQDKAVFEKDIKALLSM